MKKHGMILVIFTENEKTKLFQEEMDLLKTRVMLNKLIQLNLSLYHSILNFAERKSIPITLDSTILQLIEQIEETDIETFPLADEKKHLFRTDEDETEPERLAFKGESSHPLILLQTIGSNEAQ